MNDTRDIRSRDRDNLRISVIGELQYTEIYVKWKRKKKILLIGKSMMIKLMMKQIIITFVVAVIICREFNNLMSNLLGADSAEAVPS